MSLVLELPPELETDLTTEAARLGLSLPEYALRILAGGNKLAPVPRTGAELVTYWQGNGLVGTRPDILDVPSHARSLREQAQTRARS
jgi:hypothetical protein